MSLLILTTCSKAEVADRFIKSANRHGLKVRLEVCPMGSPHGGDIQGAWPVLWMKNIAETHVLMADAPDVLFLAGEDEIMEKFKSFDTGFVVSAERYCMVPVCDIVPRMDAIPGTYKYINIGCWMGERMYAIEVIQKSIDLYRYKPWDPNYSLDSGCAWMTYGLLDGTLDFKMDREAALFQSMAHNSRCDVELRDGRVYNKLTGTCPPLIHYNGSGSNLDAYSAMAKELYGI